MTGLNLLKKLIMIPSYVEGKTDEAQLSEFIYTFLKEIPFLKVQKQFITKTRFNIVATDDKPTKLLLYGHLDTVTPRSHNQRNQFKPTQVGDKLFGLGAVDMKAGVAAILSAVKKSQPTNGLTIFLSCDEEYEFLGTKKFLTEFNYQPELILSAEATDLMISNGCRGVLECTFNIEGTTAHSSVPQLGENAIEGVIKLVDRLKKLVEKFENKELGKTTLNLAYLNGGLLASGSEQRIIARANSVPDVARVLLELRLADKNLTSAWFEKTLTQLATKNKLKITHFKTHFCVNPYITTRNKLKNLENSLSKLDIKPVYQNISQVGYYDTQLLEESWKVPTASLGPGPRINAHRSNEYVSVESFLSTIKMYQQIIRDFCA